MDHEHQEKEAAAAEAARAQRSGLQRALSVASRHWRLAALVAAPLLLLPVLVLRGDTSEGRCAFLLLLMAVYWVTECLPLCITSLLPICLGPLLRLSPAKKIAPFYFSDTNMLFLGGLMFAVAVEHCRLHVRIANGIVRLFGRQPRWLLLGMMLPAWLLSMIISNTAATAMLLPLTDAAGRDEEESDDSPTSPKQLEASDDNENNDNNEKQNKESPGARGKRLRCCLSLGVAFAANIGGTGTLIGTPPNLILSGILSETFKTTDVNFLTWMMYGLPLSAISLVITWIMLQGCVLGFKDACICSRQQQQQRDKKQQQQQPMSFAEKEVLCVLVVLTLLWLTRSLGGIGWGRLFGKGGSTWMVSDSTPVLAAVLLLFALPSKPRLDAEKLLTWDAVRKEFPWDIILLMGGSIALAKLTVTSGLSSLLGQQLRALDSLPTPLLVLLLPALMVWVTELLSNSAATSLTLPVLASLGGCIGVNPLLLMLPVTISASFAFCLPVATPPNAIAYCRGNVTIRQMARTGVLLNLTLGLLTGAYTLLVGTMGMFRLMEVPEWANCTVAGAQ